MPQNPAPEWHHGCECSECAPHWRTPRVRASVQPDGTSVPCGLCTKTVDACQCKICAECNEPQESTCACCSKCQSHCRCYICSQCRVPHTEPDCTHCNRCQSCCQCIHCAGCNVVIPTNSQDACTSCRRCANCCNCVIDMSVHEDRMNREFPFRAGQGGRVTLVNRDPHFWPSTAKERIRNPSGRYLSVEMEIGGVAQRGATAINEVINKWQASVVGDGSLPSGGFEINTAPASGDVFVTEITELCAALAKGRGWVNSSCGGHVHVDCRELSYKAMQRVVALYCKIEPALFQVVPASRRDNQYCRPCATTYESGLMPPSAKDPEKTGDVRKKIIEKVYGDEASYKAQRGHKYHNRRYNALNLHSWFYRGTIECRIAAGSVNADRIINWGILWAGIVDYAKRVTAEDIANLHGTPFEILLSVAPTDAVQEWLRERKRVLA